MKLDLNHNEFPFIFNFLSLPIGVINNMKALWRTKEV